jgi:hypothetical protein
MSESALCVSKPRAPCASLLSIEGVGMATTKEVMLRHAPDQKEEKYGQEQYP